jgi:LacI family transcriptional regulator
MLSSGLPAINTSRERFAALERLLAADGYIASFALHHSEEGVLGRALDTFQELSVDAIVTEWLDTPLESLLADRLAGSDIPAVSLGPLPRLGCHCVTTDYAVGGRLVVEHLHRLGCRRFAFVQPTLGGLNALPLAQRISGYRAAYEDLVGPWSDAPVIAAPYVGDPAPVGLTAAQELITTGRGLDAVVCCNDRIALGLIKGLRRGGIDPVSRNIRIAGFDDAPFTRHLDVPLVTIRQPAGDVARIAAEIVLDLVQGRAPSHPKEVLLPPRLIDWAEQD